MKHNQKQQYIINFYFQQLLEFETIGCGFKVFLQYEDSRNEKYTISGFETTTEAMVFAIEYQYEIQDYFNENRIEIVIHKEKLEEEL